jgi:hypothetical protein
MDKREFVRLAPQYYAMAIVRDVVNRGSPASQSSIEKEYTVEDEDGDDYPHLSSDVLFEAGLKVAIEQELVRIIRDPFGPVVIVAHEEIYENWKKLQESGDLPFRNYGLAPDKREWLQSALVTVNNTYRTLGMESTDFEEKAGDEWEPLPLDRNNEKVKEVLQRVDETIEQVRADNGYAVSAPEERAYVLDGLTTFRHKLDEATSISYGYIKKYGLEPLRTLSVRFGKAAIGIGAAAAKEAIIFWLKELGVKLLEMMF